jgi:protein SCO1/2
MSRQGKRSVRRARHAWRFWVILVCGTAAIVTLYTVEMLKGSRQGAALPSLSGLIDGDGHPFNSQAFDHRFRLVFFGFTRCTAVCPMTLVKVRSVMSDMGTGAAALSPVFISLDPEHDKPNIIKEYTDAIDPRIVAVTGDAQRIERLADSFGVRLVRHPNSPGFLSVDHSARLYLIGPDNRLLNFYEADEPVSVIASDIALRMRG